MYSNIEAQSFQRQKWKYKTYQTFARKVKDSKKNLLRIFRTLKKKKNKDDLLKRANVSMEYKKIIDLQWEILVV